VDVIAGASNQKVDEIQRLCDRSAAFVYHSQVSNMAEMMARADVSYGGGGTTTWERCYLGLPTVTVEVAGNQGVMLRALASREAVWHLGRYDVVTENTIIESWKHVLTDPDEVHQVGLNAGSVMGDSTDRSESPVVRAMIEGS
jgi:UDP-2,4-diacetamido-2,4,6-trideoxy-beta-L-altropyranose hydrolase